MISHKNLWSAAQDYKTYKQTVHGGSYKVLLADIDELYDQFAYGIVKHPLSIRNFCKLTVDTFANVPKYLFLVGKSIRTEGMRLYPVYQGKNLYELNMVPTYGNPPSDVILTSRFNPSDPDFRPAICDRSFTCLGYR